MSKILVWPYNEHQIKAAKLAAKSIELSWEDVLTIGAAMTPKSLSTNNPASHSEAANIWRAEQLMSVEELAAHYLKECNRLKPRWGDFL